MARNGRVEMFRGTFGIMGRDTFKADYLAAKQANVRAQLKRHQTRIASRARALLKAHADSGHSFIDTERGEIDYHVTLEDTETPSRALYIEGSTAVLRRAMGDYMASVKGG